MRRFTTHRRAARLCLAALPFDHTEILNRGSQYRSMFRDVLRYFFTAEIKRAGALPERAVREDRVGMEKVIRIVNPVSFSHVDLHGEKMLY